MRASAIALVVLGLAACGGTTATTDGADADVDGGAAMSDGATNVDDASVVAQGNDGGTSPPVCAASLSNALIPSCSTCTQASCCDALVACQNDPHCPACVDGATDPACYDASTAELVTAVLTCEDGASCQAACSNGCTQSSGSGGCICNPEAVSNDTQATATSLPTVTDCGGEFSYSTTNLTPNDVDWYSFTASTNDFCGVPSIEPHVGIYFFPSTDATVCMFVKRNDGHPAGGCAEGTASTELAGFDGCCGATEARFNDSAVVSAGYDNGAVVYIRVTNSTTTCAEYDMALGYGSQSTF